MAAHSIAWPQMGLVLIFVLWLVAGCSGGSGSQEEEEQAGGQEEQVQG
jgi:hypothetical protein